MGEFLQRTNNYQPLPKYEQTWQQMVDECIKNFQQARNTPEVFARAVDNVLVRRQTVPVRPNS